MNSLITKDAELAASVKPTEETANTSKSDEILKHLSILSNPSSILVWDTEYNPVFITYKMYLL